MNLLLVRDTDLISETRAKISGRRLLHMNTIQKTKPGDVLKAGLLGGNLGLAKIISISEVTAEVELLLDQQPPPRNPLRLVLGLPRPKSLLRIVSTLTQLGIKEIHFTHSYRVDKSYWSCEQIKEKKLLAASLKGLEQSRDTILPKLYFHRRFKPFIEDELVSMIKPHPAWVAHPYAKDSLPSGTLTEATLCFGPEGGFIDYEIEKLKEIGFKAGALSERILSLETALPTIIGRTCVL